MRTKLFLLSLILSASLLILSSCRKNDDFVLPKETTSGENTLGFKVDGEVFLRRTNTLFEPWNMYVKYRKPFETFLFQMIIKCENKNGELRTFSFRVYEPILINHKMKFSQVSFSAYSLYNDGEIEFTRFDTVARIVSGKFSCDPIDPHTGETVFITEGRFDVKLTDY